MEVNNLNDLCIVCLNQPNQNNQIDVNNIYEEDLTYLDCFKLLTNWNTFPHIYEGPTQLCVECSLDLQNAYKFYKKAEDAKIKIEEFIQKGATMDSVTLIDDPYQAEPTTEEYTVETIDEELLDEQDLDIEELVAIDKLEDITDEPEKETMQTNNVDYKTFEEECEKVYFKNQSASDIIVNEEQQPHLHEDDEEGDNGDMVEILDSVQYESDEAEYSATRKKRYIGKYSCDLCDKIFPNHSRMVLHRRFHDPDRPRYHCEQCGRVYSTKQAMEVHIRSAHQKCGIQCPICHKIYGIKKGLEIHMRYHTGDFPYVCDICGKKFAQMCHLNTHRNVKHNSVRFCCDYPNCGKIFTSSSSLRNHEFSHSSMPFECEFCKRGYPAKSKLKVHIRRKHDRDMSLEDLEPMRKFHVTRSKCNIVKVIETTVDNL